VVEVASPFCGLRDRFAFSRLSLSICPRSACICQKSGRRVPTGDRLTTGGKRAAGGRHGFVVCLAQTAPLSCCTTQTPSFTFRRTRAQRHVASHSLRWAWPTASHGMVMFKDCHPFLAQGTAHESHTIARLPRLPRLPRTWFQFPSFSPHQSPTNGFSRSNIRGARKMPVTIFLVSWHMLYLLTKHGIPGRCALRNGGILQMQTRTRYPGVITFASTILLAGL
jgi:hypothetical protein